MAVTAIPAPSDVTRNVPGVRLLSPLPHVEIRSAADVPPAVVWRAFVEGFAGYPQPVEMSETQFAAMITSEGVDLAASLVALDSAGRPVGVALLMVRGEECWCGGLGVVPRFRGAGLGRRLMRGIVAEARARGLRRMRLEVFVGNDRARALYDSLGFVALRRLDIFQGKPARLLGPDLAPTVGRFDDPEAVWADFAAYHQVAPPWQREVEALRPTVATNPPRGLCLGDPAQPAAYLLARPYDEEAPVGDCGLPPTGPNFALAIVDSGVRSEAGDPRAALAALVGHLIARNPDRAIVSASLPEDDPLNSVLHACGVPVPLSETEQVLDLHTTTAGDQQRLGRVPSPR